MTKMGVIEKCNLQFDFGYGPGKRPKSDPSTSGRMGTAIHKAQELNLSGVPIKQAFLHAADEGELTSDEVEELETFHDQILRFTAKMVRFNAKHGVRPQNVMLEHRWGMTFPDLKKVDFFDNAGFMRGGLDYAVITNKNDMVIIDHKSGREKDLAYFETQLRIYALLALARFPTIRGVQTAINFTQTDNLVWNAHVKAATIREEYVPWLLEHMIKACQGLLEPVAPAQGWYCQWCEYKSVCPAFGGPRVEAHE